MDLLDRPIAFHRGFIRLTGSVTAALMLSQALYWARRTSDSEGWFWKTREQWEEETGLTRSEQESAREKLRRLPFWKEERRGVPAKLWFCIDEAALLECLLQDGGKPAVQLAGNLPTRLQETCQQAGGNPASITYTETTAETTSIDYACADAGDLQPESESQEPKQARAGGKGSSLEVWQEAFKKRFGRYPALSNLDFARRKAAELAKGAGRDGYLLAVEEFFNGDPWYAKQGGDFALFVRKFDKLIADGGKRPGFGNLEGNSKENDERRTKAMAGAEAAGSESPTGGEAGADSGSAADRRLARLRGQKTSEAGGVVQGEPTAPGR